MTPPLKRNAPLVSVLAPTFNRRRYLAEALRSAQRQTYRHFEVLVVNDGGAPVGDLVEALADPRFVLIERRDNRGKAACLNEALGRAAGRYVAYLDDDDLYHPHHLATLVAALEGDTDCGAAYTDLYKVHGRILADGSRQARGKIVAVSRDFDRFFLCYFNLAMHVSLMHRRDLLDRTGPYDERLEVMIDWDMTRRLGFFTDLLHVPEVTGEFFAPVGECDRISYRLRLDRQRYLANLLRIRTTRPPKPWPKMPDLAILFVPERLDPAAVAAIHRIYAWTFMPYRVYLPLTPGEADRLDASMPNLVPVVAAEGAGFEARLDAALQRAEGDFAAVVPQAAVFGPLWVEDALHAATLDADGRTAMTIPGHSRARPAMVARRRTLLGARRGAAGATLLDSLAARGTVVREPAPQERALRFDRALQEAEVLEHNGNPVQAARVYETLSERFGNHRWMAERTARALAAAGAGHGEAGRDAQALRLCRRINRTSPTVSSMLLEARLHKRADRFGQAIHLLEQAERILKGEGLRATER